MNSGTYYLYEYKHDRRIRTAGFLKLTCAAAGSQLQLHARGLPPTRNESLKLCSFHTNDTVILPEFLTGYEFLKFYIDINKDKIKDKKVNSGVL